MSEADHTLSEQFAALLYNSLVPQDLKKEILDTLPNMTQNQIQSLYDILKKENTSVQLLKKEYEVQIKNLRQNS